MQGRISNVRVFFFFFFFLIRNNCGIQIFRNDEKPRQRYQIYTPW